MRSYFWEQDDIRLYAYTKKYENYLKSKPDEDDICLMIHNEEDTCVGYIKLDWLDERGGSTGIYVEIDKKYRRRGYATSAMEIMLEYAFEERRLHKVHGCTKASEIGVENFLYQLGFVFEAKRTDMFIVENEKISEYYYGITEEEYRNPERIKLHKLKAPKDYLAPIMVSMDEREKKIADFISVEYEEKDRCYYCNGLKFRATTLQDYKINNRMIYDSQVCRWYDDDVKLPGLTDVVGEFEREHMNYKMKDGRLEFAIEEDGQYVGCVNLCGIDFEHRRVSASIYLRPECRSKGCGTRAMNFALSYAAKELHCDSFISCVSRGNVASAKMMYKLGCELSGVQREAAFVGGKYVDTLFFECKIGIE